MQTMSVKSQANTKCARSTLTENIGTCLTFALTSGFLISSIIQEVSFIPYLLVFGVRSDDNISIFVAQKRFIHLHICFFFVFLQLCRF